MKTIAGIVFVIASLLLYYGAVMLLLVPGRPGESYLVFARVVYGVIPVVLSLVLLYAVAWLWTRSVGGRGFAKAVIGSLASAFAAVVAIWIILVALGGYRQG